MDYLDEALADFSGYIAADELHDGPFCVLSIVDNRAFKRLVYDVLDHDPAHEDILRFFRRFQHALEARGLAVKGITTDGSLLYPAPVLEVSGPIAHQVCESHVVAELTNAVLGAVAKVRKTLKARLPKLRRGRPSAQAHKRTARRKKRLQERITGLFHRRHRKMQETVYRVRTQEHIEGRIAMDMQRDAQAEGRTRTIGLLHEVRAGLP